MSAKKKKAPKPKPMSARQYQAALDALGLTVASQQTSRLLGIGIRQSMRFASNESPVSRPVEILLELYRKHGIGEDADAE
jgi:hypothetical protein